jgi:hypothetical protein
MEIAAGFWGNGEKPAEACRQAGYAYPDQEAQRLKGHESFMRRVRQVQRRSGVSLIAAGVKAWTRVAEDAGTPPAEVIRAGERLVELGLRLRDEAERSEADGIPDGPAIVPDGAPGFDPDGFLAQVLAATKTNAP